MDTSHISIYASIIDNVDRFIIALYNTLFNLILNQLFTASQRPKEHNSRLHFNTCISGMLYLLVHKNCNTMLSLQYKLEL